MRTKGRCRREEASCARIDRGELSFEEGGKGERRWALEILVQRRGERGATFQSQKAGAGVESE